MKPIGSTIVTRFPRTTVNDAVSPGSDTSAITGMSPGCLSPLNKASNDFTTAASDAGSWSTTIDRARCGAAWSISAGSVGEPERHVTDNGDRRQPGEAEVDLPRHLDPVDIRQDHDRRMAAGLAWAIINCSTIA